MKTNSTEHIEAHNYTTDETEKIGQKSVTKLHQTLRAHMSPTKNETMT